MKQYVIGFEGVKAISMATMDEQRNITVDLCDVLYDGEDFSITVSEQVYEEMLSAFKKGAE